MKNLTYIFTLVISCSSFAGMAQVPCADFNKVRSMMESGFASLKGNKITESTTNYGMMLITKKIWASVYRFPYALSSDITEVIKVAPDPKNAGHNVFMTFNFAKNVTKAAAEAIFNRIRDDIRSCTPANWKTQERSGTTYSKYYVMDGNYYDESPQKITLQFSKLEGPGDRYTTDLMFDGAVK